MNTKKHHSGFSKILSFSVILLFLFFNVVQEQTVSYVKTTTDGGRDNSFVLKYGVKIYGGFACTETNLTEHNWEANKTVLSGDINHNNTLNNGNACRVVISASVMAGIVDGFTITGGNANGGFTAINVYRPRRIYHNCGGGIFNNIPSSPTLINNANQNLS
jgi:hypothetical protein